jgi:hypothetical protein
MHMFRAGKFEASFGKYLFYSSTYFYKFDGCPRMRVSVFHGNQNFFGIRF